MPTRTARTAWNGDLQKGSGQVELTSSGRGSVSKVVRSHSTPAGSWKAPTRFLPAAVLMSQLVQEWRAASGFE